MRETINLRGTTESLQDAQQFLSAWWQTTGLEEAQRFPFELALEELLVNIATHGARLAGSTRQVSITLDVIGEDCAGVRLLIADDGPRFDLLSAPHPDTNAPVDERPTGGLGVHLAHSLMDSVEYWHTDQGNHVQLEKSFR